ncbi:hypothetical protein LIER_32887 [Lithospermum erythrorhizon]|uniref:Zinc knuckle CX2CX4HX4C domain-containing protein n=1 Tax=Lithospermum erythrorhizon TaxID=34254 RepID=A0AAV3RYU0_LITER
MSYAHCLVDVDMSKPPVMEFGVKLSGGRRYVQKVTYECYPDYCCNCKVFGHNIFKCPKNEKVDNAPVVSPPVVPPPAPHDTPVPVVSPMVTRSKACVKTRSVALSKDPSPKECVDGSLVNGSLPGVNGDIPKVDAQLSKGKGLKGVGKAKTTMAQVPVVSPNSFDVLNGPGEASGSNDMDTSNLQIGALVPSICVDGNQDKEGGEWQHVSGGAVSSLVSPCG